MSSSHSLAECPLVRNKKRQHDSGSDVDDDFIPSSRNKKRSPSEYLGRENNSKTKTKTMTPLRDVTFRANTLQEQEIKHRPVRDHVIKTDPLNANDDHNSSTAHLWSQRSRTGSSQDANCANTSERLSLYHIIKTSCSQDDESNNHAQSECLPRYQMTQRVLEAGDTYNARSECVEKVDEHGSSHKGRTASGTHKDECAENKSSSDPTGGINFQSSEDGEYKNDNSETLPENEEGDRNMQALSHFRRIITTHSIDKKVTKDTPCHSTLRSPSHATYSQDVIAFTRQNRKWLFPITEKKSGVSKTPRSLLQKVLSRSKASIPLTKFSFLEDEIEFVDIIGETTEEQHHARIFRITAGGRSFALKVHKYREDDISHSHPQFPLPNQRFDHESTTYARTAHLQDIPSSPIPKCYGYVELTKIPQARSRHQRDPFRSTRYTTAAYLDFLIQGEDRLGSENQQWRRYFRDRPPSACILRGIVLEDISSYSLVGTNLSHQPKLISSGRESLARLHQSGVLHGDVSDLHHALFTKSHGRIVWVGLGMSYPYGQRALRDFDKRAAMEIRLWESLFVKPRSRLRKQKAKSCQ